MSSRSRAWLWRSKRNAMRSSSTWSASAGSAEVGEFVAQRVERCVIRRPLQPDHQQTFDVAKRVVVRVEAGDLVDRLLDVIGDEHEIQVVLADVAACEQLAFHEIAPGVPERPSGNVEQDDRRRLRLSRLDEGQQL